MNEFLKLCLEGLDNRKQAKRIYEFEPQSNVDSLEAAKISFLNLVQKAAHEAPEAR